MSSFKISISSVLNWPAVSMIFVGKPVHHLAHEKDLHGRDVKSGGFRGYACFGGDRVSPNDNSESRG